MRRLLFLSLALNALVLLAVVWMVFAGPRLARDLVHELIIDVRHDQKASMFRQTPVRPGAVIFLGNSITEGGNWQELFPDHEVLNRGIGGDVATGVLDRMDEVVRHEPSILFLCIGTNDLADGIPPEDIAGTVRKILVLARKETPATRLIVQSVLPVRPGVVFGHRPGPILQLNEHLLALCKEMNVTYLDIHDAFADADGFLREDFTNDGLHLLGPAYLMWEEILQPVLNERP